MQPNSKVGAPANNFVMIYDPKCKACNAFKPEYAKIAELVQKNKSKLNVLAINNGGATPKVIPGNFEIQYYPTILFFKNDQEKSIVEFNPENGDKKDEFSMDFEGIKNFLAKQKVIV